MSTVNVPDSSNRKDDEEIPIKFQEIFDDSNGNLKKNQKLKKKKSWMNQKFEK